MTASELIWYLTANYKPNEEIKMISTGSVFTDDNDLIPYYEEVEIECFTHDEEGKAFIMLEQA